jgi:hypothetical protein
MVRRADLGGTGPRHWLPHIFCHFRLAERCPPMRKISLALHYVAASTRVVKAEGPKLMSGFRRLSRGTGTEIILPDHALTWHLRRGGD